MKTIKIQRNNTSNNKSSAFAIIVNLLNTKIMKKKNISKTDKTCTYVVEIVVQ